MKINNWKHKLSQLLDENQTDEIINNFVLKHQLDFNKFEANFEKLRKTEKSIANFWGVNKSASTPSMDYFNPGRIAPAFPLWFYATYPDVMQWFHKYQKKIMRSNNYNEEKMSLEMAKLFNIDTSDKTITKNEIFDKNGQYFPSMLENLIESYIKMVKKDFETSL